MGGSGATQVGHEFIILVLRNLKQKDHQPGLKDCLIKSKKLPFIYTCNPCTQEVGQVDHSVKASLYYIVSLGQLGLHETLSSKTKQQTGQLC